MSTPHDTGPSQRQLRVAEAIRHALADILLRGDFRDPALANTSITVTEVRISPDLKHARVLVLPLGGVAADEAVAALSRAAPYLRGQLNRHTRLRSLPRLQFIADDRFAEAEAVNAKLRTLDLPPEIDQDEDDETPAREA